MGSRNRRMIFVHVTWSKIFTLIINQITESKKNLRLLLLNLTVVLHQICNLHHIFSPKVLFWIIIYIFFYLFQVECYKAFAPYCFFPFSLGFFFFSIWNTPITLLQHTNDIKHIATTHQRTLLRPSHTFLEKTIWMVKEQSQGSKINIELAKSYFNSERCPKNAIHSSNILTTTTKSVFE